jgi:hypothetical protein
MFLFAWEKGQGSKWVFDGSENRESTREQQVSPAKHKGSICEWQLKTGKDSAHFNSRRLLGDPVRMKGLGAAWPWWNAHPNWPSLTSSTQLWEKLLSEESKLIKMETTQMKQRRSR